MLDALKVRPIQLDAIQDNAVVVEGIVDYYLLSMLDQNNVFRWIPSVGANSIKFYVSLLIAWNVRHWALWDNDDAGRRERAEAERFFGKEEADRSFRVIPLAGQARRRILQDLVSGDDIAAWRRSLSLPRNAPFDKVVVTLYYSDKRQDILASISKATRESVKTVLDLFT